MGHIVKCKVCGKSFDRDVLPCIKVSGNRYAHEECCIDGKVPETRARDLGVEKTADDLDLEKLKDYISKLFGRENCNWPSIMKNITKFKKEYSYTYSGIYKSLVYYYEVKHGDKTKANNNIGIVPFIYNDAYQYYLNLFLIQQQNQNLKYNDIVREVTIEPPQIKRQVKLFDLGDNDD